MCLSFCFLLSGSLLGCLAGCLLVVLVLGALMCEACWFAVGCCFFSLVSSCRFLFSGFCFLVFSFGYGSAVIAVGFWSLLFFDALPVFWFASLFVCRLCASLVCLLLRRLCSTSPPGGGSALRVPLAETRLTVYRRL